MAWRSFLIAILMTASVGLRAATPALKACEILLQATDARGTSQIKQAIATVISSAGILNAPLIAKSLEIPKKSGFGDYALPLFALAKEKGQNPMKFTQDLAAQLNAERPDWISEFSAVAGFLNIRLNPAYVQSVLEQAYLLHGSAMGHSHWANGKVVVLDYVSPNLAKPLHIGHFRASVIGQAIRGLAESQGFRVIGLNHLGDWGIQFGHLIWAFQHWGTEYDFTNQPFESLYQLYVRVKKEAPENKELEVGGRDVFRRMESGDPEVLKIWERFREITLFENQKVLDRLGIHHDLVLGEAFYNDHLPALEADLKARGLLIEDAGALGVCVEGGKFCILRTQTGTSVYAARDIASAVYRQQELHADQVLYVVGNEQKEHFQNVFQILDRMGLEGREHFHHIGFGLYLSGGKKVSSRDGGTLTIQELIDAVIERTKQILRPDIADRDQVALQVGLGALIFNDLSTERNHDVDFTWERVLNLDGGAPYIQSTIARARATLEKSPPAQKFSAPLNSPDEVELMKLLLGYQETLTSAYTEYQPSGLTHYLFRVARAYNSILQVYAEDRAASPEVEQSRLFLARVVSDVLQDGLSILNISSPSGL